MEGFWPIFFLMVVLKIPVFSALWLVWWASKAPEPEGASQGGEGGFRRSNPQPSLPRGPRRDPHGGAMRGQPRPSPAQRRGVGHARRGEPERVS